MKWRKTKYPRRDSVYVINVDSCIFEDEDFMAALGPAVIDDDYGEDFVEDYECECEWL